MNLHLDGSRSINAERTTVFRLLTDPNFLATTLPDAEEVRVLDGSTLEAKIKMRLSVVTSTLRITMRISERDPPARAALAVEGSGAGSSIKVSSAFTLSGDAPTAMAWSADAEITGVMAGLGTTLLKGFAAKKVEEIFSGITKTIEEASRQGG